jgi:TonB family protein
MVYLVNQKRIIHFPPPKEERVIVLDLTKFQSPPKPKVEQKIIPKPIVKDKIKRKPIKKKVVVKRKSISKKKILVAKESTEDNNKTKNIQKKIAKLKERKRLEKIKKDRRVKREIAKKRKRIAELKKMEEEMKRKEQKAKRKARIKREHRKRKSSSLANSLMSGGVSKTYNQSNGRMLTRNSSSRLITQLYGKEFDSYSSSEKKFLKANLGRIHVITQRALSRNGYPESAIRMGQEGVNVVSFYLHPNGNITNLKLERSMGHSSLDNNTLQVIRIAYSNYPLPKVRTKIKFYVNYTIN